MVTSSQNRIWCKGLLCVSIAVILVFNLWVSPAHATRLSEELKSALNESLPPGQIRLDGSYQTKAGDLFLPLLPALPTKGAKVSAIYHFPSKGLPDVIAFSNNWVYTRVIKRGQINTVTLPILVDEKIRKTMFTAKFPPDLIVPENLVVPLTLRGAVGENSVATAEDEQIAKPDFGQQKRQVKEEVTGTKGSIFIACPQTGKIIMVDEGTLQKVSELATEGTPAQMAFHGNRLYIADQAKGRVLVLDAKKKEFLGQIDLPKRCAPKGLAMVPSGKILYCSESSTGTVDSIETATGKVLLKTRTQTGPGRMKLTPDASHLLVLNTPIGRLTIISTINQSVQATIAVGAMPNAIAITSDSNYAYISNRMSNTVSVVDINKKAVVGTLKTGLGPTGLALSKDGNTLIVADAKDDALAVYDMKARERKEDIKLPLDLAFPGPMTMLPDGKHIVVSSAATSAIGILNTESLSFEQQPDIGNTSDEMIWTPISPVQEN